MYDIVGFEIKVFFVQKFNFILNCYTISILFVIIEGDSCEFGSPKYFALCGFGGILSCGLTHTAVVPLDLVKCRIQVRIVLLHNRKIWQKCISIH